MRLRLACLFATLLLACCGEDDEAATPTPTPASGLADLTLVVDGDGPGPEGAKEVEVRCEAADDSALCRDVAGLAPDDFAPTPANMACTQQYGGPQTAQVTGTLHGERIDATFSREQGCEIARWDAVVPVLDRNPIP